MEMHRGWYGMKNNQLFFKNKKIFITGHTGFKGTWMAKLLLMMGADVYGYALEPTNQNMFFQMTGLQNELHHIVGDIRDLEHLNRVMQEARPDIVIHMAAQPIVREGYANPVYTYETNVMGTVHLLETLRNCESVQSVVNVTTDKVYKNIETDVPYKEENELMGYDPYSNSKSCSELVTYAYKKSFMKDRDIAISTCRAGNVIGGGDFASNRIIPDCVRAVNAGKPIIVRNPDSVRPYQHVLDPVCAYLLLAHKQYEEKSTYEDCYNIGPLEQGNINTGKLVEMFCENWGAGATWKVKREENAVHEAKLLYLDCNKVKEKLGWNPIWNICESVEKTVEWYKCYTKGEDIVKCMESQINEFLRKGEV